MHNGVGVELEDGNQRGLRRTDRGLQAQAVLLNVFPGVPLGKPEVQDALAIQLAGAARPRGEAVDEPRELRKLWNLQDAQPAMGTLGPWRCGGLTRTALLTWFAPGPGSLGRCHAGTV